MRVLQPWLGYPRVFTYPQLPDHELLLRLRPSHVVSSCWVWRR